MLCYNLKVTSRCYDNFFLPILNKKYWRSLKSYLQCSSKWHNLRSRCPSWRDDLISHEPQPNITSTFITRNDVIITNRRLSSLLELLKGHGWRYKNTLYQLIQIFRWKVLLLVLNAIIISNQFLKTRFPMARVPDIPRKQLTFPVYNVNKFKKIRKT